MEKAKDCEITFLNKKTYEFNHEDLLVALDKTKDMGVWAMRTPWGIFQPMDAEMYDNVKDAVMGDHEVFPDSSQEDLQ